MTKENKLQTEIKEKWRREVVTPGLVKLIKERQKECEKEKQKCR